MSESVELRVALVALILFALFVSGSAYADDETTVRNFAANVLALRQAGVAGDVEATAVLAILPGSQVVKVDELAPLWRPSFANTIVTLGRLSSPEPVALYYDPLIDIALLAFWRQQQDGWRVVRARALPGERLDDRNAMAGLEPSWLSSQEAGIDTLTRVVAARLKAFHLAHPADAREPSRKSVTFASAAADTRAALLRLAWNAAQRALWTEELPLWLRPLLLQIESAMASRDPIALSTMAPETDAETSTVLAVLPAAFARELELDMIVSEEGDTRLLIGSLPTDGDVYVMVLCRLVVGGDCEPRRLMLVSLLE